MASINLTHLIGDQTRGGEEASEEDELSSLPRENGWATPQNLYFFEGFWCPSSIIPPIKSFQKHFQAKDSDVVVATMPKSGTTWLKALTFAILNRHHFSISSNHHPLLKSNSHELVPFFELDIYDSTIQIPQFHLSNMTEPRIFGTHVPFPSLAKSIKESNCRIIYICRNPFDTFVSTWIFVNKISPNDPCPNDPSLLPLTLEEAFERYCKGISPFGPFWDHMLGYLKESMARPDKVLFLKYEDLKNDVNFHVKKIGNFLGCPFTREEESNGVIQNIIELCSFEKMKKSEANKSGTVFWNIDKKHFFRKAEVGDWVNYLSPSMAEKLSKIIEEKLSGSVLSFKVCP